MVTGYLLVKPCVVIDKLNSFTQNHLLVTEYRCLQYDVLCPA